MLSCKSGSDPVIVPTNLVLTANVATDGTGVVTFKATADNATYYTFDFGDGLSSTPLQSESGAVAHGYTAGGTYVVKVTANTSATAFISTTKDVTVSLGITVPTTGYVSADNYPGKSLVWSDEFSSATINASNWTFEKGDGCPNCGRGNNELEYYTDQNAIIQDGNLIIKAKKENVGGKAYTSTRMITKDKVSIQYGRIDIRAVLPRGQGIWPALWMLGDNIGTVGWPACGEIDIMEMIGGGGRENTVYGTVHWNQGGHASYGKSKTLATGTFADEFHVYSLEWTDTKITWLIDDVEYASVNVTSSLSAFNKSFFFIINLAVGGNWPGNPDSSTTFPQYLIVDYVRVFK